MALRGNFSGPISATD